MWTVSSLYLSLLGVLKSRDNYLLWYRFQRLAFKCTSSILKNSYVAQNTNKQTIKTGLKIKKLFGTRHLSIQSHLTKLLNIHLCKLKRATLSLSSHTDQQIKFSIKFSAISV